ncbi:N-glycosidase [Thalassocella blandensis]|nr:N-glycosidase [Thalassocella blandensis]
MNISTKAGLLDSFNAGKKIKFIFFWGHRNASNEVNKSCLSQWYESSFIFEGNHYVSAEQFMMASKANLFGDTSVFREIISTNDPGKVKALGRTVKNFDQSEWDKQKFDIVTRASYLKFSQNDDLKYFLLNTGDRVLVEASPKDRIWGIGLAQDHPHCTNPNLWKGENLLGFALMQAREQLKQNKFS